MQRKITAFLAMSASLASPGALLAHHSGSMYAATPMWVQGMVVGFEDINPHTVTLLESRTADGQVRRWAVEGPGRSQIDRGDSDAYVPRVGDALQFCAFPYKPVEELSRMFPDADFSTRRFSSDNSTSFVAGHIMVMPDGGRRVWEPHGLIGACILSSDEPDSTWIGFLDADPRARQGWCTQRDYALIQTSETLRELVEAVNESLENPCN